jgi:hypothetical protein
MCLSLMEVIIWVFIDTTGGQTLAQGILKFLRLLIPVGATGWAPEPRIMLNLPTTAGVAFLSGSVLAGLWRLRQPVSDLSDQMLVPGWACHLIWHRSAVEMMVGGINTNKRAGYTRPFGL